MAYTKILVIHNRLDKCVDYALDEDKTSLSLDAAIDYAFNRDKTESTCFETAINCECDRAYRDMMETKRRWGKETRPRKGYHIIQSFVPGEATPAQAHAVGTAFAERLLGDRYEVIVATHLNKEHLHCHIVFNSVSFVDGKMYRDKFKDYYGEDGVGIRGTSDAMCLAHGLSIIEQDPLQPPPHKSRPEWEGKTTIRDTVRRDVDAAIVQAYTYKNFLECLRRQGYEIKSGANIKHTAVRITGGQRFIRLDSLGEAYTEEGIKARLAAARSGTAEQALSPASPPAPSWYLPGKRYSVRGSLRYKPRKLCGFRALYFKYLYLLGTIKKRRPTPRAAFSLRQDLIQFDRYQEQFRYLNVKRIETAAQLSMQYDALQAEIDACSDRRKELYKQRRHVGDSETEREEITAITKHLRSLRRELNLCARIEADIPKVREQMQAEQKTQPRERSKNNEKTDKSRPL